MKKVYDKLKSDRLRGGILRAADAFGVRKDVIRMDTNNICNIRCIMCRPPGHKGKAQFMSLDKFKAIIDAYGGKARMLYLSCSHEPLLTPNFCDYVNYAKQKKIPHVSICTNGLLLTPQTIADLVDCGLDEIILSFNGFQKDSYERIMKGADFQQACDNVKALSEYKRRAGTRSPLVRLNTILMKSNLEDMEHILSFMETNDIATIQFRELMLFEDQNDGEAVQGELLANLSLEEYERIRNHVRSLASKMQAAGKEVILPATFLEQQTATPKNEDAKRTLVKAKNPSKPSCSIPFFSYWIDLDGGIRVCGFDKKAFLGNPLKQELSTLRKRQKAFQKLALSGECSRELCTLNVDTSTIL